MPRTIFFKQIKNTAITAGTQWIPTDAQISEDTEISRFGFFNHLTVYNNSPIDVELRLNGANISDLGVETIPANGILVYDQDDQVRYTRPAIHNPDSTATIAANDIIMVIRKVQ